MIQTQDAKYRVVLNPDGLTYDVQSHRVGRGYFHLKSFKSQKEAEVYVAYRVRENQRHHAARLRQKQLRQAHP